MMKVTRPAAAAAPLLLWASTTVAQEAQVPPPAARQIAGMFEPPSPGKGQVVFYRTAGNGGLMGCMIREGEGAAEVRLSKLKGNRYFVLQVEPGTHQYWARSVKTDQIRLEIEEGETYFVRCTIATAMFGPGGPNLSPSDQSEFEQNKKKMKPMEAEDKGD